MSTRGGGGAALYEDTIGPQAKVQQDEIARLFAVDPVNMKVQIDEYQKGYAANDRGLKYQIEGAYAVLRAHV